MKAQVSVEFLFGLALVLAMMAALVIPTMRESELAAATQATRLALANHTTYNRGAYSAAVNVSRHADTLVNVNVTLVNRATQKNIATPQSLKTEVAYAIRTAINSANPLPTCTACPPGSACTTSASFAYCVI